jgi:transposase
MSILRLSVAARQALEYQLRATHDARVYRRTLAILQIADGRPCQVVAQELHVSPRSVQLWLVTYRHTRQPQSLVDRPGRGRPRLFSAEDLAILEQCLTHAPPHWGYPARGWTVPLLQQHLLGCGLPACSPDTLRRCLDACDSVWKRPRYVLEPDPEKEKKTPHPSSTQADRAAHPRAF